MQKIITLGLFLCFALSMNAQTSKNASFEQVQEAIQMLELKRDAGEMTVREFGTRVDLLKRAFERGNADKILNKFERKGWIEETSASVAQKKRELARKLNEGQITEAQFRTEAAKLQEEAKKAKATGSKAE
jgi:gamma-glutamylcysteine synthetase